jgi:hypothetical protein
MHELFITGHVKPSIHSVVPELYNPEKNQTYLLLGYSSEVVTRLALDQLNFIASPSLP